MSDELPRRQESRDEAKVRELLGVLREDIRAPAGLRRAVMREIRNEPPGLAARIAAWLFSPRLVPVSPAVAGVAMAALAAVLLLRPSTAPVALPSVTADQGATRVVTRFVLVAPGAQSVHVTGDFTSWNPEGFALEDLRGSGIWTGDIALPPGVHQYTFVVDGSQWVADPSAVLQVDDGFGQTNSILVVQEEDEV